MARMPPVRRSSTIATPPVAWVALICWERALGDLELKRLVQSEHEARALARRDDVGRRCPEDPHRSAGRHDLRARRPGEQASSPGTRARRGPGRRSRRYRGRGRTGRRPDLSVRGRARSQIGQVEAGDLLLDGPAHLVCERTYPLCSLSLAQAPARKPKYRAKAAEAGLRAGLRGSRPPRRRRAATRPRSGCRCGRRSPHARPAEETLW